MHHSSPGSRRFWMKGHFRSTPSALITSWRRSVLRGVPASVTRPSSPRYFGDESSPRARGTSRPPMRNVWVTLRRRSQTALACSTKPVTKVIQVAIWTEIVGLSKLMAEAVNVVYPEPKGDVVAGEQRAVAAAEVYVAQLPSSEVVELSEPRYGLHSHSRSAGEYRLLDLSGQPGHACLRSLSQARSQSARATHPATRSAVASPRTVPRSSAARITVPRLLA